MVIAIGPLRSALAGVPSLVAGSACLPDRRGDGAELATARPGGRASTSVRPFPLSGVRAHAQCMKVREVMTAPVVTVKAGTDVKDVVAALLEHDVSAVPVVDDSGVLVGIVSEGDLLAKEAYGRRNQRLLRLVGDYLAGADPHWLRKAGGTTAADVMTAKVVTAAADERIEVAARRMLGSKVKRLVVVDDGGHVVGIVSRPDILSFFLPDDTQVAEGVRSVLADVLRVPETAKVEFSVSSGIVHLSGTVLHPSDRAVVEGAVRDIPGVVDVVSEMEAREEEPRAVYPVHIPFP